MKKLLLHSCCAPCSSSVLERLVQNFEIALIYYNPNIHPKAEYEKRKKEQIRLINEKYPNVQIIDADYDVENFIDAVKGYEKEKEGGARCEICFRIRLNYVANKAKELNYDIFTTTLSVSPHKNAKLINEIGVELSRVYGVEYLISDFKKQNGYLRSIQISKEMGLYRQNYCGCKYSYQQSHIKNI